jgi:hypothetical protein
LLSDLPPDLPADLVSGLLSDLPPPDWARLMASTSSGFFMERAPEMPMLPAIAFRSATSMELSPPRFFGASAAASVDSMVSVT